MNNNQIIAELKELKIASGRILRSMVAIELAKDRPGTTNEIIAKVMTDFNKLLTLDQYNDAFARLYVLKWVDDRGHVTDDGATAERLMEAHKDSHAARFFRPSNSPNVENLLLPDLTPMGTTW